MSRIAKLLERAKTRLLPPSSRSFHRRVDTLNAKLDRFSSNVADQLRGIELVQRDTLALCQELMRRYEQVQREQADLIRQQGALVQARTMHNQFFLQEIYRNGDEEDRDMMKRLFASIPPATGAMRVSQLATARLAHELDVICAHLGIEYWFSFGSLVATVYREGAIPWDDDVDVGMRRKDVDRLATYLRKVNDPSYEESAIGKGYEVTVIYDGIVKVRQVRFCSTDKSIPCFIDLSAYDTSLVCDEASNRRMWELHNQMVSELEGMMLPDGPLSYWATHPFLRGQGSGVCSQVIAVEWDALDQKCEEQCVQQIEDVMWRYLDKARKEGLIGATDDEPGDSAAALVFSIESLCEVPDRSFYWDITHILPTQSACYEGYGVRVPREPVKICDVSYGRETPYLPTDILGHNHYAGGALEAAEALQAMRAFAQGA